MALSDEEKNQQRNRGLMAIILIVLGGISFFISNEKVLDPHTYEFEVSIVGETVLPRLLNDFQIYYDFVNSDGKISFYMTRTNSTDYIDFYLPKELEVYNLNWTSKSWEWDNNFSVYTEGIDYKKGWEKSDYPNNTWFRIKNLNKTLKNSGSRIELAFKGRIYPNADFRFMPGTERIMPPGGSENGAFFKFNLGNKYACWGQCYWSFGADDLDFYYRNNTVLVSTSRDQNGERKNVAGHRFVLNYNKENNEILIMLKTISISLIFSGFILLLEFLLIKYFGNKRKNRKKKSTA